ncbi:hypothetical protein BOX15_Mlig027817g1 [Macrostomum lignano]|uniref:Protein kinase domain-containing protein n=1 Tax=Macrostomum lignano TaxID=282301 RepID=A0A267H6V9_9PLAT|nr:hypothetical protein BOX15_Mlig027817g1 [Macrostomum lignano]
MESVGEFEYSTRELIGHGAFALVYKGRHSVSQHRKVAIKVIQKKNLAKSQNLLSKEIKILKELSTLKHDNVVGLLDCIETGDRVFLVMEYCNGGDLAGYLMDKKTLSEDTIRHFLRQIARAMQALASRQVVHRDMKPHNFLLNWPEPIWTSLENAISPREKYPPAHQISIKIADFGFARFLADGKMAGTLCGSPMYMAPEVLMSWNYDSKADLWSIGTIVYQCLTGTAPFHANTPQALKDFYERNVNLRPRVPPNTSPELTDLLLRILRRNPADRISFEDFYQHQFLSLAPASAVPMPLQRKASQGDNLKLLSASPLSEASPPLLQQQQHRRPLPPTPTASSQRQQPRKQPAPAGAPAAEPGHDFVLIGQDGAEEPPVAGAAAAARLFQASSGSIERSRNLLRPSPSPSPSPPPPTGSTATAPAGTAPASAAAAGTVGRAVPTSPGDRGSSKDLVAGGFDLAKMSPPQVQFSLERRRRRRGDSGCSGSPASLAGLADVGGFGAASPPPSSLVPFYMAAAAAASAPGNLDASGAAAGDADADDYDDDLDGEAAPELSEETLMSAEHMQTVEKLRFVLTFVDYLTELAQSRSAPLTAASSALGLPSELQRHVEQLLLYSRIQHFLSNAVRLARDQLSRSVLRPTAAVKELLTIMNRHYHQCHIRCKQLQRHTTSVPDAQLQKQLSSDLSAEKLIYQYAVEMFESATLEEAFGELEHCFRQYKAARVLLHGLAEIASSQRDQRILTEATQLVEKRLRRLESRGLVQSKQIGGGSP